MSKLKIIMCLALSGIVLFAASPVGAYGVDGGDGHASDPSATAPKVCSNEKPEAPFLTALQSAGANQARLSWNTVDHATQYAIQYGLSPRNYIYGAANVGSVASFTINQLQSGMTYYVAVQAVNGCMPSELSNERVITVGANSQDMQYESYGTDQAGASAAATGVVEEQKKDLFAGDSQEQPIVGFWARIWHSLQVLFGDK